MTARREKRSITTHRQERLVSLLLLIGVIYFAIIISGKMSRGTALGLYLAATSVLPSTIPFMIISDLYLAYGYPERIGVLAKIARGVLHLPGSSIRAIIIGNLSGFPIGAKIATELYTGGGIDKKNAEKLIAFSNNPSIPFTVSVVGLTMLKDIKIGILLLIIVYISTFLTALVYRDKGKVYDYPSPDMSGGFDLVASVRKCGDASISIVVFISLFYGIITLFRELIANEYLIVSIASVLELTSAVNFISLCSFSSLEKTSLTGFALGFGGLSVMMQTAVFTKPAGLSLKPYFKIKLTEGFLSFLLVRLLYPLLF